MDAIELLTTRSSMPRLIEPGPSQQQMDIIRRAAVRSPDHMNLSPYRFIEFSGSQRQLLADICAQAAQLKGLSDERTEQARKAPFRAPTIIVSCLRHQPHDKVPWQEQLATVASATMAMQQASFAQNLGAIWRTGWLAEDDFVRQRLGCTEDDEIVAFLYIGTPAVPTPIKPPQDAAPYFQQGAEVLA